VIGHLNLLKLHPDVQAMMLPDEADEKYRITFQIAQLLSRLDEASQLKFSRKIVKAEMSTAAARRMILKDPTYRESDTRGREFNISAVESIVAQARDRIGVYLDMPGSKITALIDVMDNRSKRLMVEAIDELCDELVPNFPLPLSRASDSGTRNRPSRTCSGTRRPIPPTRSRLTIHSLPKTLTCVRRSGRWGLPRPNRPTELRI
jgi:hypothetical protein